MPIYRFYFNNETDFVKLNKEKGFDYTKCFAILYSDSEKQAYSMLEKTLKINNTENAWYYASIEQYGPDNSYTYSINSKKIDSLEQKNFMIFSNIDGYFKDFDWYDWTCFFVNRAHLYKQTHSYFFVTLILNQALYLLNLNENQASKYINYYQAKAIVLIANNNKNEAVYYLKKGLTLLERLTYGDTDILLHNQMIDITKNDNCYKKLLNAAYEDFYSNLNFIGINTSTQTNTSLEKKSSSFWYSIIIYALINYTLLINLFK